MKCQTIKLYERNIYEGCEKVTLDIFIRERAPEMPIPPRPAMLVFGGGGYAYVSDRETEPIGVEYLAAGYNVFQLKYSVAENAPYAHPLLDAALAIATIRRRAAEWDVDPDKIAVIGFSAGGHLAASMATVYHRDEICIPLGLTPEQTKPNAAVLAYPVISAVCHPNVVSFKNLLGKELTQAEKERFSCEYNVDENTCPCFLFHTANDNCVPVQNSIVFANALSKYNIPYELHILPDGCHGISRANLETAANPAYNIPYVARWSHWAIMWLNKLFCNE